MFILLCVITLTEFFQRHPEGILQIYMTTPEEADAVLQSFDGRFFGGKRLTAEIYDGKTKFKIEETDAERDNRLKNWESFIEADSSENKSKSSALGDEKPSSSSSAKPPAVVVSSSSDGNNPYAPTPPGSDDSDDDD